MVYLLVEEAELDHLASDSHGLDIVLKVAKKS
jgi:hypothetical protein